MKSCLVLLTKTFPFDTGEEFIENELPVVAEKFNKVILIATSVSDHPARTRPVPGNAEVHAIRSSDVRRMIPAGAVAPFAHLPGEYAGPRERKAIGRSLKRRMYFAYFVAKGNAVGRKAAEILSGTDIDEYGAVTFYSYWLYDTALAALSLKRASRAARRFSCSRAHRYDLYPERSPSHYLPLRPYLLKNLDAVRPCSEDGSRYLRETYPEFSDKVATAYLGTKDYGPGPENRGPEFHLVSCCHISPVKRVEILAQALARLSGSGLKLKWTHFGGGEGLDALKQYADVNLGFLDCTFAGEVKNERLMEFYRTNHVDCFVNTSSSEGLPVSIMEACSFGIPVLATDVGGTGEIVRDGENGSLLGAGVTPEELARKIETMYRMPGPEQSAFRAASRRIWQENFCAETNYARFAEEIDPLRPADQ